jgi:hypothetical protein
MQLAKLIVLDATRCSLLMIRLYVLQSVQPSRFAQIPVGVFSCFNTLAATCPALLKHT